MTLEVSLALLAKQDGRLEHTKRTLTTYQRPKSEALPEIKTSRLLKSLKFYPINFNGYPIKQFRLCGY